MGRRSAKKQPPPRAPMYLYFCNALLSDLIMAWMAWVHGVGACPPDVHRSGRCRLHTAHLELNTFLTCSVAVPFSFTRSFPNMQTPTLRNCYLFILGRFHRCCLSGRTLSMKKMRILMSCGNLKGAQAAPLSPKSPYAAHHLQSLSSGTPSLLMPSAFPGY